MPNVNLIVRNTNHQSSGLRRPACSSAQKPNSRRRDRIGLLAHIVVTVTVGEAVSVAVNPALAQALRTLMRA